MRLSRTSLAWLMIAALMFGAAISLTMSVTWTQGGTLQSGQGKSDYSPPQFVSIYVKANDRPLAERAAAFQVSYDERDPKQTKLRFFIPNGEQPTFVISGFVGPKGYSGCDSDPTGQFLDARVTPLDMTKPNMQGLPALFYVRPAVAAKTDAASITCIVKRASHPSTFVSREAMLQVFSPPRSYIPPANIPLDQLPFAKGEYHSPLSEMDDWSPLPFITLGVTGNPGAKNMWFDGGREAIDASFKERKRVLSSGDEVLVGWDNEYSQQMRDLLLIVIGTLIAVGVTVTIEGLRPMIEGLERSEKNRSAKKDG